MSDTFFIASSCIASGAFGVLIGLAISGSFRRDERARRDVERLTAERDELRKERDRLEDHRSAWSTAANEARIMLFDAEKALGAIRRRLESKGDTPKQGAA